MAFKNDIGGVVVKIPEDLVRDPETVARRLHAFRGNRDLLNYDGMVLFRVHKPSGEMVGWQAVILPLGIHYTPGKFIDTSGYEVVEYYGL